MTRHLLPAQQLTLGYVASIEKEIAVNVLSLSCYHSYFTLLSGISWKNMRPWEFKCCELVMWRYNCKFVTKTGLADQLKLTFLLCPPEDY
jgi:hypothetical protein